MAPEVVDIHETVNTRTLLHEDVKMRTVETLIDEACAKCGTDRRVCELVGLKPQQISSMRAGRIPISPQTVGLLCEVLELQPDEAQRLAAEAIVRNAKPERRATLMRAFFGRSLAGAAVLTMVMLPNNTHALMTISHIEITLYTLCAILLMHILGVSLRRTLCGATPQALRVHRS